MLAVLQRFAAGGLLCAAFAATLFGANPARAVSLSLSPSAASVYAGAPVAIDIVIDGLGAGTAPTLAAFDLDVSFLGSVLSFVSVDFAYAVDAFTSSGLLAGPLRVDLAETSLLSNAVLDAYQPATFVLATLHFLALAPGVSPLAITQAVLANTAGGGSIAATLGGASVTVLPVPEPISVTLVGLGLAALAAPRRGRRGDIRL